MRFLILLLCVVLPSLLLAEPPLIITEKGYYWMDVRVDPPVLHKVSKVIDLTNEDDDDEPPPPPPPIDELEEVADLAEKLAEEANNPRVAKAIAAIYGETAKGIDNGNLTVELGMTSIRMSIEVLLDFEDVKEQWQPFRDQIGAKLDELKEAGLFDTPKEAVAALQAVQSGLLAAGE